MPFSLRTWTTFKGNLPNAEKILVSSGTDTLDKIGRELKADAQTKVKRFTGETARRIKVKITGKGLNKLVEVYGELVTHYVDQMGLPPGTFPPWDVGSRIYKYAEKKGTLAKSDLRRRPRRISHVATRRPAHIRAKLRAQAKGSKRTEAQRDIVTQRVNSRGRGTQGKSRATRTPRQISRERQIRRIAFRIALSVFERGIRPNQWVSKTLEANRVKIIRDLENAFYQAVNLINRG
jgi:hypothetical protein